MSYLSIQKQQTQYFNQNITRDYQWRKQQLLQIKKLIADNESAIIHALKNDLHKPVQEAWLTEISYVSKDVDHVLKHLKSWMKPSKVSTPIVAQPGRSFIQPEPLGSVLIIGAWNYPFQLIFAPLVAVIAAGNCALLKPSELAPNVSALIAQLVPKYLDNNAFAVVEGAVNETTELLTLAWDHIMYTGNGTVARIVMAAAAKHLTPVTLELGGKSPVYIDTSADLTITAERIAWGKWMNAGQTCIAPDYIMVEKELLEPLLEQLKQQIHTMFGDDPQQSDSYGRIVNHRHTERIASYLEKQNIAHGGRIDLNDKYIEPTIIVESKLDSKIMTEEIFGPLLPIIVVDDYQQAKRYVLSNDKPLAAYLFTKDSEQQQDWINTIAAGSQCINDVMMFNAVPDLPFGGTGSSGMGQYSGYSGFTNFSHMKAVLKRPFLKDLPLRFAPYSDFKLSLLRKIR
ncbi:aldehyde dehydrogenase family protein [Thalassotalea maritima]|uniref:aldehyde dehydrogenase family protein n=1 Tax=Thalassotalea maritima TaxID=3242416 RepID=UPI0035284D6F